MKAAFINNYGSNDNLKIGDISTPEPEENEVQVEIHAASINPVDFKIRDGKLKILINYKFPLILGNDFAGVITKTGKNVSKFKTGDKIYARADKYKIGTFAEYICINQDSISIKPENMNMEQSASIPLVGLTTWQCFFEKSNLKKDTKVLIHAGSGGVGSFAIQLAKAFGAYVATTTSTANVEWVKSLGADIVIDYKKQDFSEVLKDYDLVFDTLGGVNLEKSFKVLKKGGDLVSVSGTPDAKFADEWNHGLFKKILFTLASYKYTSLAKKYNVNYKFLFMHTSGEQLQSIKTLIEENKIKAIIDKTYSLDETKQALEYVEKGHAKGKVIIKVKDN